MEQAATIILQVGYKTITLKQWLQRLRIDSSLAAVSCCTDDLTIECWAESLGLTAPSSELQAAVNRFRRVNELLTAADTTEWLTARGMTLNELVALLKPPVLKQLVIQQVVTDAEIRRHFLESSWEYDRAEISTLVMEDYGAVQELRFRVEEGADFHALARRYSSDAATAKAGGYVGAVGRKELAPEAAAAVFNAEAGALLGPFEGKREYRLILVEALHPAELNEAVEANISELLFQEKLAAFRRTLDIREEIWSLG